MATLGLEQHIHRVLPALGIGGHKAATLVVQFYLHDLLLLNIDEIVCRTSNKLPVLRHSLRGRWRLLLIEIRRHEAFLCLHRRELILNKKGRDRLDPHRLFLNRAAFLSSVLLKQFFAKIDAQLGDRLFSRFTLCIGVSLMVQDGLP